MINRFKVDGQKLTIQVSFNFYWLHVTHAGQPRFDLQQIMSVINITFTLDKLLN